MFFACVFPVVLGPFVEDFPASTERPLLCCQTGVDCIHVGLFLGCLFCFTYLFLCLAITMVHSGSRLEGG